jgi:glycosyltransferase involved in cell wall biosynthesis
VARLAILTAAELTRDSRARRQVAAARRLGFEVVGISGQISGETEAPLEGVEIVRVGRRGRANPEWERGATRTERPLVREARGLFRLVRLAARTIPLARAARAAAADVVHANDLETLPAAWLATRGRARLVYDAHELYAEFEPDPPRLHRAVTSALERTLARRADAVVTVSEPIADELERRLGRRPLVVLNAPELDAREPEPTRRDGPLRAVYQGAFGRGRQLEDLLDAIAAAPTVRLTIRVVRMKTEAIRVEVERRGLAGRVEVEEPLPPDRLLEGLRGHDVGIVFDRPVSRNAELSSPNKLFEYLAAGLAVVAPRLPGFEAILDGVGVLYDDGLAEALESLSRDREAVATLRERSHEAARERLNARAQEPQLARAWTG